MEFILLVFSLLQSFSLDGFLPLHLLLLHLDPLPLVLHLQVNHLVKLLLIVSGFKQISSRHMVTLVLVQVLTCGTGLRSHSDVLR